MTAPLAFSTVEAMRRELRALSFDRLTDAELAKLRTRLQLGHHNNAMSGITPSLELAALFDMFSGGARAPCRVGILRGPVHQPARPGWRAWQVGSG